MATNARDIVHVLVTNGVELRIEDGRLIARWAAGGSIPEGAAQFIRRFKSEIITELSTRAAQEEIAA